MAGKLDIAEIFTDLTKIAAIVDKAKSVEAALPVDTPDVKKGTAIARAVVPDLCDLIDSVADQVKS
jgi:hypothetical protein